MKHSILPAEKSRAFYVLSALFLLSCLLGGCFGPIGEYALTLPWGLDAVIPSGYFILLFTFQWALCMGLLLLVPRAFTPKQKFVFIFLLALAGRLCLLAHEPSDDINRYLWEGRMLTEKVSPYHHAPDDARLKPLAAHDPFHAGINHPHMTAAYPPLMLAVFSAAGLSWYHPLSIKWTLLLFDLGTMVFLAFLLARRGLDFRWLMLYALNPVVLYAFAGQGHFDAIQGFLLTCSLFFYDRKQWKRMFFVAGLLFQVKYVAVLWVPFLVNRKNWRHLWIASVTAMLPYALFLWGIEHENAGNLFKSIYEFGENFAFNGSVHAVLRVAYDGIGPATKICAVLLFICLGFGFVYFHPESNSRYRNDPVSGCFFVMGCVILLAPTIHFWYLSWIVPFLVLRPSRPWLLLCLTISFYFVANGISHHTGVWRLPVWACLCQWLPFYFLLVVQGIFFFKQTVSRLNSIPPGSVSVVIPAKDEEARIVSCIWAAFEDPAVTEVIVVDGGSVDRTRFMAEKAGARVLTHPRSLEAGGGRGGQIRAGIDAATGDLVAVVHADVIVGPPNFTRMCHVLHKDPRLAGGALGSKFESAKGLLPWINAANDWRMVFLGISFGDQVQFFRRDAVASARLFPRMPLMEDVEFGIRLYGLGPQVFLFGDAVVSTRRWQVRGVRNAFSVVGRTTSYLIKRACGTQDTSAMYQSYYGE